MDRSPSTTCRNPWLSGWLTLRSWPTSRPSHRTTSVPDLPLPLPANADSPPARQHDGGRPATRHRKRNLHVAMVRRSWSGRHFGCRRGRRRGWRRAYITLGIGGVYSGIQTFREWTFGRYTHLRQPQRADLPEDRLLPDASNLPLILLRIEHADGRRFNELLKLFLPRFERMSTLVSGNTVQFFLHEQGLSSPLSAARLSDGTLRFIAILATLLNPTPTRLFRR